MKKALSIILALAMLLSAVGVVHGAEAFANPFKDVPETAWYHDDVVAAASLNLINGKAADRFAPDDNLTYAEAIKLAACMNQLSTEGKVTLTNGNPWYQTYVDYCKANKIISKEYNYTENTTRAGYVEIFANALTDDALKAINQVRDGAIPDVPMSAAYAPSVYKMYRAGILQGVDLDYNFNPNASIRRGEVATILVRMMVEDRRVKFDIGGAGVGQTTDKEDVTEPGKDNQKAENWDDPTNIPPENPEITNKVPTQEVTPDITVLPTVPVDIEKPVINSELTIHKQPEGAEYDAYGKKHELEVQVFGGKAPYTYEWYYKERRDNVTIKNGDYVKDASSEALVLSVEKENTLLGVKIYCKITDSLGDSVTTEPATVYGPFSMPVESYSLVSANKEYTLVGRVADGILRKGEKVSVIRGGKVIAIGIAKDLQMFNKSMDETVKGDNVGIVFEKQEGAAPGTGDTVVKYQEGHKVDTSDVVN